MNGNDYWQAKVSSPDEALYRLDDEALNPPAPAAEGEDIYASLRAALQTLRSAIPESVQGIFRLKLSKDATAVKRLEIQPDETIRAFKALAGSSRLAPFMNTSDHNDKNPSYEGEELRNFVQSLEERPAITIEPPRFSEKDAVFQTLFEERVPKDMRGFFTIETDDKDDLRAILMSSQAGIELMDRLLHKPLQATHAPLARQHSHFTPRLRREQLQNEVDHPSNKGHQGHIAGAQRQ